MNQWLGTCSTIVVVFLALFEQAHVHAQQESCVSYDSSYNTIFIIDCDANFVDIPELEKENSDSYILNSDIIVGDNAILYISGLHLKIADSHTISVYGKIFIDDSNITSWNTTSNDDVIHQNANGTIPRGSIMLYESKGGHIRNSQIAHLGYERVEIGFSGLELQKETHDFEITNSEFYDMWMAFYSNRAYNITVDSNDYHDNLLYALDPHTKTHEMNITNNQVHDNKGFGIICSLNCRDILVQNNTVYNNGNAGIMLSRNTSNSIVSNNTVYNQSSSYGIFVSQSPDNQVYNNTLTNNMYGIYVKEPTSTGNVIENNEIIGGKRGMVFYNETSNNTARNNTFANVSSYHYFLDLDAKLTIDNQEDFSYIKIRGADGTNHITIANSGVIKGQDTNVKPFSTTLSNSTLVVMNS